MKAVKIGYIRDSEPRDLRTKCDYYLANFRTKRSRKKRIMKIQFNELKVPLSTESRELIELGVFFLSLEKIANREKADVIEAIFLSHIPEIWSEVSSLLESIFFFLTSKKLTIHFVRTKNEAKQNTSKATNNSKDAIFLFSGGLDSFASIWMGIKFYKKALAATVIHNNIISQTTRRIVNDLMINLDHISLNLINRIPKGPSSDIQQTRGFTYLTFAASLCEPYNCNTIIVGESGPTMFQPQLLYSDLVSKTTNKEMLRLFGILYHKIFGEKIIIETPFENNTKAEVISLLPDFVKREKMSYFFSCFNSRSPIMCGHCYSCVVRKLGSVVAGAVDTNYKTAICSKSFKKLSNIIHLVNFAVDLLKNPDFLPVKTKNMLARNDKYDLFRRFSLDILAGLYLICVRNDTGKNNLLKKYVNYVLKDNGISVKSLEERISSVRNDDFPRPTWLFL